MWKYLKKVTLLYRSVEDLSKLFKCIRIIFLFNFYLYTVFIYIIRNKYLNSVSLVLAIIVTNVYEWLCNI